MPDVVMRDALSMTHQVNPLLDPLLARWRQKPDRLFALLHEDREWRTLSLDTVMRRACQFAALYRATGLHVSDIVAIILPPGLDAYAAYLGAMLQGLVPSFLAHSSAKQDAASYWRQHRTVMEFCRPALVLVGDELLASMQKCTAGSGATVIPLGAVAQHAPVAPSELPPGNAICLLQFSSGTTGLRKAVSLSYDSIARQLDACTEAVGLDETSRVVSWLPLYHDMGLISSFLLPAWLGVPIIALDPFVWVAEPSLLLDAVQDHGGTHAWLPNFAFLHLVRRCGRDRQWDLSGLRALVSCSEPCKPAAFDAFLARFGACGLREEMLQTSYAMAEAVFAVSQSPQGRSVRRLAVNRECVTRLGPVLAPAGEDASLLLLSNGPPVDGCSVGILRDGTLLGEREIGEICVEAPFLMSGYFRKPEASAGCFHGSWFRTGDLGFLDEGEVFVVGRLKDVIIVNGKNIFAHDVEAAVSRVEGVKPGRCVAFGHYSEKIGSEQLVVVAERLGDPDRDAEVARLINGSVVDEIGIPCSDIRMVDAGWLAKTTSGKTSRSENAGRYARLRQGLEPA